MFEQILYILLAVLGLGFLVFIHEFGHFAVAKLLKIRVLVFSLGFGPRLAGFTRGGTEYRLSPIPLGGYVKMAGETFDEERKGDPAEFLSHPRWHRFLVAIAGPSMNILLAIAILAFFYVKGVPVPRYPKEPAIVGPVYAGTASGFMMFFFFAGNLLAPPIGNLLADRAAGLPFVFWGGLVALGIISLTFTKASPAAERSAVPANGG